MNINGLHPTTMEITEEAKKEAIRILHTKVVQTQVRIHKQTMALILQIQMATITSTVIHKN